MTKLTYGKKDQVKFLDESEKIEAINYLKSSMLLLYLSTMKNREHGGVKNVSS